jgi:hypothetical protein
LELTSTDRCGALGSEYQPFSRVAGQPTVTAAVASASGLKHGGPAIPAADARIDQPGAIVETFDLTRRFAITPIRE